MIDPGIKKIVEKDHLAAETLSEVVYYKPEVIEPLINRLKKEKNVDNRSAIVLALCKAKERVAEVVEALLEELKKESHPEVRDSIVYSLGELGDQRAVMPLVEQLEDGNQEVRTRVIEVLNWLTRDPAVKRVIIKKIIERLNDDRWEVRWNIARLFCNHTHSSFLLTDKQAVMPLVERLEDEKWEVRSSAAFALGRLGDQRAVMPLLERLEDEKWKVRKTAAFALGRLGDRRAVMPLLERLEDEKWEVRKTAARALGELGDKRAVLPLVERLEDGEREVRKTAALALGRLGDQRAVLPLITRLSDSVLWVREKARASIKEIVNKLANKQAVLKKIIERLNDDRWEIRYNSTMALGELGDKRAVMPLVERLEDGNSKGGR